MAGERWAWRNQAYVAPEWVPDVDRRVAANRWVSRAIFLALALAVVVLPRDDAAWAAVIATAPGLLLILWAARLAREIAPGPRVARLRELSMSDCVPNSMRGAMWGAAALACAITLAGAWRQRTPFLIVPGVVLLAGAATVEVVGRRLARLPEPAVDASHLYLQDCFRVDTLRMAGGLSVIGAYGLLLELPAFDVSPANLSGWWSVIDYTAVALLFVVVGQAVRSRNRPAAHMRARLWPTLAPEQTLAPGEAVPTRAAS
jgi:hypothetical protein